MLFVALKGERFDGHDYVRDVLASGAAGAMVEHAFAAANPGLPLLAVNDTRWRWGSWRRLARPLRDSPARHHRQQRQDHGQGDVRRDPARAFWRAEDRAGHRRQPQQRHRPAADAARLRASIARR
jgi:hypothetical protein